MVSFFPSTSRPTSSAKPISGSLSGGNSTSMTGPVMVRMRPSLVPSPLSSSSFTRSSAIANCAFLLLSAGGRAAAGRAQRLGPAHDFHYLGCDLGLSGLVVGAGQAVHEVICVVGGRLHRPPTRGMLGCSRLQESLQDQALDVARQEVVEYLFGIGLEHVLGTLLVLCSSCSSSSSSWGSGRSWTTVGRCFMADS